MRRIETYEWWPELLDVKDELSLRELAERFNVTPGAISAAFKRTGISRSPAPPGPRAHRKKRAARPVNGHSNGNGTNGTTASNGALRPGSKDHLIHAHYNLLGNVPDAEVAARAGVSPRTIASFRSRHSIPGYSGPRRAGKQRQPRPSRIDPYATLVGTVPDRVIAEKAGVSLNAVRNYRVKRGIPAAGRPGVATETQHGQAWRVTIRSGNEETNRVVIADDLIEAATRAANEGDVVGVQWVGELL